MIPDIVTLCILLFRILLRQFCSWDNFSCYQFRIVFLKIIVTNNTNIHAKLLRLTIFQAGQRRIKQLRKNLNMKPLSQTSIWFYLIRHASVIQFNLWVPNCQDGCQQAKSTGRKIVAHSWIDPASFGPKSLRSPNWAISGDSSNII